MGKRAYHTPGHGYKKRKNTYAKRGGKMKIAGEKIQEYDEAEDMDLINRMITSNEDWFLKRKYGE